MATPRRGQATNRYERFGRDGVGATQKTEALSVIVDFLTLASVVGFVLFFCVFIFRWRRDRDQRRRR